MPFVEKITDLFLIFILCSVVGWVCETIMYAIRDKKAVKRGFLFGPLCPIYGSGAVVSSVILYGRISDFFAKFGDIRHYVALFFLGMILCDVLEYVASYVLEKIFKTRWWDYSYKTFQINGRICLTSSLLFGFGVATFIKYVQPYIFYVLDELIPLSAKLIAAFVIYTVLIIDVMLTVQSMKDVIKSLREIEQYAVDNAQKGIDKVHNKTSEYIETVRTSEQIDAIIKKLSDEKSLLSRAKKNFPTLHGEKYNEAMNLIFPKSENEEDEKIKKAKKKRIRSGEPVHVDDKGEVILEAEDLKEVEKDEKDEKEKKDA